MEIFPRYWSFVRGIHRSPLNFTHRGQWRGALMFSLICAWINGWANHLEAGDLRRHLVHYDVTVIHRVDSSGLQQGLLRVHLGFRALLFFTLIFRITIPTCQSKIWQNVHAFNFRAWNISLLFEMFEIFMYSCLVYNITMQTQRHVAGSDPRADITRHITRCTDGIYSWASQHMLDGDAVMEENYPGWDWK